jgi:hypothetical protein
VAVSEVFLHPFVIISSSEGKEPMVRRFAMFAVLLATASLLTAAQAVDEKKKTDKKPAAEEKFTATCPVSGQPAKEDVTTSYKKKNVYLCCGKCKAAFEKDNTNFTTKANHQLVQTKQFRQAKCPFSGGDLVKGTNVKVAKVAVRFCCDKCKAKAEGAKGDDQVAMIFAEEPFKKAFVAKKAGAGKKKKAESDS